MFCKKGVTLNSQKNTCNSVSFLIKLQAEACKFVKKEALAEVFSCEFLLTVFLKEYLKYYLHDGGPYHIETSPSICRANQRTCAYMIGTSVMKELNHFLQIISVTSMVSSTLKHCLHCFMNENMNTKWINKVVITLRKKWNFPLRISSVNVTKSVDFCAFGHISSKNPSWKTSFFCTVSNTYLLELSVLPTEENVRKKQ